MNDIPEIGLGTWKLRGKDGQAAVEAAIEIGYRHIDTADYYHNHDVVGEAIKRSGLRREEIYIVSKVMPPLTSQSILGAGPRFLDELQTDYIDLLLVHWPDANPIKRVLSDFMKLKEMGIAKRVGVSNFSLRQIKEAVSDGFDIYNHQFEIYPGNFDQELVSFCQKQEITVTAYSPLAEGRIFNDVRINNIAKEAGVRPAQTILGWLIGKGIIVIPKAESESHLKENFQSGKIKLSGKVTEKLDNF